MKFLSLIYISATLIALSLSQNILLQPNVSFDQSDMDCFYQENNQYLIWPYLNVYTTGQFQIAPNFASTVQSYWSVTYGSACQDCSQYLNIQVEIDYSMTASIFQIMLGIEQQISQLNLSPAGSPQIVLNFIVNQNQVWSGNTTVNYLFWQVIIYEMNRQGYAVQIVTDQDSWNTIFGSSGNPGFKFLFCNDFDGDASCDSAVCSFGDFSEYFKVFQEEVAICEFDVGYANMNPCQ